MPSRLGSFLFAALRFSFSLFFCNLNLFLSIHLYFFGGSNSCVSNLGFPSDDIRFTVPKLKFLNSHEDLSGFNRSNCSQGVKTDFPWCRIALDIQKLQFNIQNQLSKCNKLSNKRRWVLQMKRGLLSSQILIWKFKKINSTHSQISSSNKKEHAKNHVQLLSSYYNILSSSWTTQN